MIEFLTLILGLVLGPWTVQLEAGEGVASVEMRLDNRIVARLDAPPWTAEVDFGNALRPQRLVAIARDAEGREIGRAVQKVNYLRAAYEAVIVLEAPGEDAAGTRTRGGRLVTRAILDQQPTSLALFFDGRPVAVAGDGSFSLPAYDSAAPHALEAEASFPDGGTARAELAFGGGLGERLSSTLTAVPLRSTIKKPWTAEDLAGAFRHRGETVPVFAARAPAGLLVIVHDRGAESQMRRLNAAEEAAGADGKWFRSLRNFDVIAMSPRDLEEHPGVFPFQDLGPVSPRLGARGVLIARTRDGARKPQKLWAALATAGKQAAARGRPRAVALVLGTHPDATAAPSGFTAARAADYLDVIRVPLFVWAPTGRALERAGLAGRPRTFSGRSGFGFMAENIERELSSQTVVWLEGDFFPHELEITADAPEGLEWAR